MNNALRKCDDCGRPRHERREIVGETAGDTIFLCGRCFDAYGRAGEIEECEVCGEWAINLFDSDATHERACAECHEQRERAAAVAAGDFLDCD